jgi:hypothetical protein
MQIHYALFLAHPTSNPPFNIVLGLDGGKTHVLENCLHIPDGVSRIESFVKENQAVLLPHFTLIYPIYMEAMGTNSENTMLQIAWLIKDEADAKQWGFDRVGGLTNKKPQDFVIDR